MLADVSDARRAVRFENKGEYLTDEIGICLTLGHIPGAFGTGMKTIGVDTCPDFAPSRLLVPVATGAFLRKILTARTAI